MIARRRGGDLKRNIDAKIKTEIYIPSLPSFKVSSKFFSKRLFTLLDIRAHVVIWRGKIRVDILYIYIYVRWGNLWKDDEFENEFMELKKLLEKGLLKGC